MNAATLTGEDKLLALPTAAGAMAAAHVLDDPLEWARFTQWRGDAPGPRLAESSLQLSGMTCAACAGAVEAALLRVSGVHEACVSAASQRARITWDPARTRPSAWLGALRSAGYDAAPDAAAPARALREREARQALWRLFVAAFCAMQVMMLAAPAYVAEAGELAPDLKRLLDWSSWLLTLPVLAFSCAPFFRGAWRSLRARRIGIDVPVALGITITFAASMGAAFEPGGLFGSEVYFDSLTMFVSLLLGARYLEMRARHRAAEELEAELARLPETAERLHADGTTETVSVLRLRAGERVRVPLGAAFPADGLLLEGQTRCDESLLTGEAVPVARARGEAVVAGSINLGAPVVMQVQRAGPDTRYAAIVAMMRHAAVERPALARVADRFAAPFLWGVLALSALGALAWSFIDPARAVWVAVSVLIVTCPCALSLAAPATLLAAARGLSRRGVRVQRLDAIEALAVAEQVFFDKTGTLTQSVPALAHTRLTDEGRRVFGNEAAALAMAAALAAWSRHPLSLAVVQAAAGAPAPRRLAAISEQAGLGVQANEEGGGSWRLGSRTWLGAREDGEGDGQVCLSLDGRLIAAFDFDEALRPGAAQAVAALQAAGLRVTLLSGDQDARTQAMARRLGITDVRAAASPADKLAAVAAAQAAGRRVAMVGDGVNDAPVLARADVAIAMGEGALVARSRADAVLVSGRPGDLVAARVASRRAMQIVRQNLLWAATYNLVCVPLALLGLLPPWAAGLGMAVSSLLVVGNALRAAR